MPRKPNYKFERMERERQKAAKKAARLEAKKNKAEQKDGESMDPELDGGSASSTQVEELSEPSEADRDPSS